MELFSVTCNEPRLEHQNFHCLQASETLKQIEQCSGSFQAPHDQAMLCSASVELHEISHPTIAKSRNLLQAFHNAIMRFFNSNVNQSNLLEIFVLIIIIHTRAN